ncbi:MAG: hypothetical protein LM587_02970 [Candidatus Aenigmarchaeota archaeon]|nr:hypothetical protein [Candidatus Aenigmarchaeota archaeon]
MSKKNLEKEKLVSICASLLFISFFVMIILKIAAARDIEFCIFFMGGPYLASCGVSGDYAAGVTRVSIPPSGPPDYCEIEDCVNGRCYDISDRSCSYYLSESDYVDRFVRCYGELVSVKVVNREHDAAGLDICPNYTKIWGDSGDGKFCIVYCSYNPYYYYGVWDGSEQKCIVCSYPYFHPVEVSVLGDTNDIYCPSPYQNPGDKKCESACGAPQECDEQPANFTHRHTSYPEIDVLCDSSCQEIWCYGNACEQVVAGISWTCVYMWPYLPYPPTPSQATWMWLPTNAINSSHFELEDGLPWQECFDGYDNDCDGYTDCADYECKGVQNPNTGTICCQSDSDCPKYNSTNHLKMYCDINTHTCKTIERCGKNDECEGGWCCDRDPSLPSSCRLSGSCVAKGTRMCNNQYICDPPEGFVSSSNENANNQASKKLTLIDLLINPFSYFFKR